MKRARGPSQRQPASRQRTARSTGRSTASGTRRSATPPPSPALDHLRRFVDGVADVVPRVKKLFEETSRRPPDSANQQTRFANKLDGLATVAGTLLDEYVAARDEVARLPRLAKCSPGDALAKRIMTGLKVTKVADQLQQHLEEMQRLATRARQPMSPEESRTLHDKFAELVSGLGGILDLAQNVRRLIEKQRERFADARSEEQLRRIVTGFLQAGSQSGLRKLASEFDSAFVAIDKVDAAVLDLCRGISRIVGSQGRLTKAVYDAEKSVIEQQDAIRVHLREFEEHARTFITTLKGSDEYRELASHADTSPLAAVPRAVEELVAVLQARLDISLTWLETIEKREAAAFVIPGGLMHGVRMVASHIRDAHEQLNQYVQRYPTAEVVDARGSATTRSKEKGILSRLGESERLVVDQIIVAHDRGEEGTTISDIAASTGLAYATVRRILVKRLGPPLVRQAKQDRRSRMQRGGQVSSSPPDIFSMPQSMRASCRRELQAARKTP
jgi:hypothetical protein